MHRKHHHSSITATECGRKQWSIVYASANPRQLSDDHTIMLEPRCAPLVPRNLNVFSLAAVTITPTQLTVVTTGSVSFSISVAAGTPSQGLLLLLSTLQIQLVLQLPTLRMRSRGQMRPTTTLPRNRSCAYLLLVFARSLVGFTISLFFPARHLFAASLPHTHERTDVRPALSFDSARACVRRAASAIRSSSLDVVDMIRSCVQLLV